jgi:pyridoxal biosynthesis lyase PdxS
MLIKFDANTVAIRTKTNNIPSLGIAERATAIKLKSRNGRTNVSNALRHVLIVRKNLIVSTDKLA